MIQILISSYCINIHRLGDDLPASEKENLELNDYNSWFLPNISSWLVISKYKAMIRIGKAVGLDSLQTIDSLTKFSSSAVDTITVFYQVISSTLIALSN